MSRELRDLRLYNLMHLGDNWEILAGLLVLLCSDTVESIEINYRSNGDVDIFELVSSKKGQSLPKLRRVRLTPDLTDYPMSARIEPDLLLFPLSLNYLSELELVRLRVWGRDYEAIDSMQETFATRRLSILDSQISPQFLRQFLQKFNSLTHFKYRGEGFPIPTKIMDGLSNSIHCLEELVLEDPGYDSGLKMTMLGRALHKTMVVFPKLRTLVVEGAMLLGHESETSALSVGGQPGHSIVEDLTCVYALPQALERLRIHNCHRPLLNLIRQLLLSPILPPRLRKLEVSFAPIRE